MSNVTYIRIGNSIVVKTVANRSSDVHNSTDLVFLFDNAGDAHVKSSISIALTIAACAFLLSCYSCCCFNGFSSWTRSYRFRSRFARSPFTEQTTRWRQHLRQQRRQAERGSRLGDETGDEPQDTFGLVQNYSLLLSKLEKLAFAHNHGDHKHSHEDGPQRTMTDSEYSRFISDVWIGVVLTLLILSIVFFICSCFLYHKFQQWKNTYRTNSPSQAEVIRRYDLDVESLPSYTLVSGLPSYDDALDQFRKAGIIIQHPSVIKIFEDTQIKTSTENGESPDNASVASCSCGASQTNIAASTTAISPVIELTPKQLKMLSQKRLSLQITLNGSVPNVRRNSRSRVDLCREVNRSNLLRSHDLPNIHRSTSSLSTERNFAQRLAYLQHRGSLS